MEKALTLSIEECDNIIISLLLDFKKTCSDIDVIALDDENERGEFDMLMDLGALIQKMADVRDTLSRCQ